MSMTVEQFIRRKSRLMQRHFGDAAMKEALKSYADIIKQERQDAIVAQKAPDGSRYARLKLSTVKEKRRRGSQSPSKALIDKGYLKNPITQLTSKRGKVVRPKSRVDIITYQDEGTEHIPARKNWAIYPAAERRIDRMWKQKMAKFLRELARG